MRRVTGGRIPGWFQTPRGRVGLALSAVVAFWTASWFFVVVGLVAPMSDFDHPNSDSGELLSHIAL